MCYSNKFDWLIDLHSYEETDVLLGSLEIRKKTEVKTLDIFSINFLERTWRFLSLRSRKCARTASHFEINFSFFLENSYFFWQMFSSKKRIKRPTSWCCHHHAWQLVCTFRFLNFKHVFMSLWLNSQPLSPWLLNFAPFVSSTKLSITLLGCSTELPTSLSRCQCIMLV